MLQLGVTATISWTTVATWFGSGDEKPPLVCAAGDRSLECNLGHQREPVQARAPSPDAAGARRLEDIKIIDDLAPRRRRGVPPPSNGTKPPPEANSTKDGDLGVHPPADYYDDIFARLLGLVGELLGRAAVAAITWLWAVLDWLGAAILGAWWARLKWVSMIMIGAVLFAGLAVLCVVAWVAVRSAVRACK